MPYLLMLMVKHRSITLPVLANPRIFAGGAIGERKSEVLELAGDYARKFIAPYGLVDRSGSAEVTLTKAKAELERARLSYPIVAKPETGLRGAGVRPIADDTALQAYIAEFPLGRSIMLQEKVEYPAEAGVFYVRHPTSEHGEIFSLTLKYSATITGDGKRTIKELVLACPRCRRMQDIYLTRHAKSADTVLAAGQSMALNFAGNHARGSIFRDGADYITEGMTQAFDAISKDFPELHFARFDVRFDTIEALQAGHSFQIVEVNGVGAEATHIWDCRMTLMRAYRTLCAQWRMAYEFGAANAQQNHSLPPARELLKVWVDELTRANDYPLTY